MTSFPEVHMCQKGDALSQPSVALAHVKSCLYSLENAAVTYYFLVAELQTGWHPGVAHTGWQ